MSTRLIPWCLAATGFLAAFTLFTWHGKREDPGSKVPPPVVVAYQYTPPATEHHELPVSPASAVSEPPDDAPPGATLPLPPVTQPEPDANVQPVADDTPTVDDLPARPGPGSTPPE